MKRGPISTPAINRFEDKIFYSPDGCWYWTGGMIPNGYGFFNEVLAHRASYSFYKGDPENMKVLHICGTRLCVNPHHLQLGPNPIPKSIPKPAGQKSKPGCFENHVMPEPNTGCWFWISRVDKDGYGLFRISGKNYRAHRISYEMYRGPIPEGNFVCHSCDTPLCVNPDHLWAGTHQDNMDDMMRKGRHTSQKKKNLLT